MAQKTNPVSFGLGLTRVWNSTLQIYGKSYSNYFLSLHKCLMSKSYLQKYFFPTTLAPEVYEWKFHKNAILVNIRNSYLTKFTPRSLCKNSNETINRFFTGTVLFQFFQKSDKLPDIVQLARYARYLLEANTPPKKVALSLCHLVRLSMNSSKVSYYKFGVLNAELKGFKIQVSGRFSSSKNQMAKKTVCKVGLLPLTRIKSSIDYLNTEVHTKLGTCGLQIWLFYEIRN